MNCNSTARCNSPSLCSMIGDEEALTYEHCVVKEESFVRARVCGYSFCDIFTVFL